MTPPGVFIFLFALPLVSIPGLGMVITSTVQEERHRPLLKSTTVSRLKLEAESAYFGFQSCDLSAHYSLQNTAKAQSTKEIEPPISHAESKRR